MDFLYKQMRERLSNSGQEKEEESSSTKDKRMQPQKTQSFKEKKRTPSWVQRQFSKQMSKDYSKSGDEYQAAVAAAAFAIKSLEESRNKETTRESRGRDTDLTKVQSKPDNIASEPEGRTRSLKFPDQDSKTKSDVSDSRVPIRTQTIEEVPGKATGRAPSLRKTTTFADILNDTTNTKPENEVPGKAIEIAPSMKKASTFGDKNLESGAGRKPGTAPPKPDLPPSKQAVTRRQSSMKPSHYREADEWEKAEIAKIKEKYERLDTTIHTWENKKKTKAKRQLDRIEAELVKRRGKATQQFIEKVARIDNIAGGAKAQALQNKKNEEFKVKEKANKMRLTGKLPNACLCF